LSLKKTSENHSMKLRLGIYVFATRQSWISLVANLFIYLFIYLYYLLLGY